MSIASTAVTANVSSSGTSGTIFAANPGVLGRMLHNDSTAILYLKFGTAAATSTSYTVKLIADAYYEFPTPCYSGQVTGIWVSANGSARTTQVTS